MVSEIFPIYLESICQTINEKPQKILRFPDFGNFSRIKESFTDCVFSKLCSDEFGNLMLLSDFSSKNYSK